MPLSVAKYVTDELRTKLNAEPGKDKIEVNRNFLMLILAILEVMIERGGLAVTPTVQPPEQDGGKAKG